MLGGYRDLHIIYGQNDLGDSGLLVIVLNVSLYWGVMFAVKTWVIKRVPKLLDRLD